MQVDVETPLTNEQIERSLAAMLADVHRAFELTQQSDLWEVAPGSSLHGDDLKTAPYQISHVVRALFGQAVDHLHAVVNLHEKAEVMHFAAPFTLVRGAIENAAAAVWLLSPPSRSERVTRRIRLALTDSSDSYKLSDERGFPRPQSQGDLAAELVGIGVTTGIAPAAMKGHVSSTDMVTTTSSVVNYPLDPLTAWRICSGIAHGRTWAHLSFLVREAADSSQPVTPDVGLYRITSDSARLTWALGAALACVSRTQQLYQERARAPWPTSG